MPQDIARFKDSAFLFAGIESNVSAAEMSDAGKPSASEPNMSNAFLGNSISCILIPPLGNFPYGDEKKTYKECKKACNNSFLKDLLTRIDLVLTSPFLTDPDRPKKSL